MLLENIVSHLRYKMTAENSELLYANTHVKFYDVAIVSISVTNIKAG